MPGRVVPYRRRVVPNRFRWIPRAIKANAPWMLRALRGSRSISEPVRQYQRIAQGRSIGYKRRRVEGPVTVKQRASFLPGGGKYVGKFKRPRRRKTPVRNGVKIRTESNGEVTASAADRVVWIGGTAVTGETLGRHMFLAVLKGLAKKMGVDFQTEHEFVDKNDTSVTQPNDVGSLYYTVTRGGEPDSITRNLNIPQGSTWGGVADIWWADVKAFWFGATSKTNFMDVWINFYVQDSLAPATEREILATEKLCMKKLLIDFIIGSQLKLQNRTGADTPTETNSQNVEQNPLVGKMFELNGNLATLAWTNDSTITPSFVPNQTSGIVTIDPQDASYTQGITNMLIRPPNKNVFRYCKRDTLVRMQPGHIKSSYISDKGTMYFDTMFDMFVQGYAAGQNGANYMKFGKLQLFCLEKTMRTGTGTATVNVGYEHNQYHTLGVRENKNAKGYIMEQNTA
jgi:hypothetical protein